MKSPITKLAAAAAIVIAVMLSMNLWDKATPTAYALDQTIQASHSVRYLHIKAFDASHEDPKEIWVEFDVEGEVENVRVHLPEWVSPHDGPLVLVWGENKVRVWVAKKNILGAAKDKIVAEQILRMVEELDPGSALERMAELQAQGRVTIEIEQPSDKAEPIVVTATGLPQAAAAEEPLQPPGTLTERELSRMLDFTIGSLQSVRAVLFVDQATKLVLAAELYRMEQDQYGHVLTLEYHDYNQNIDPEMFVLDDEVPADAMRVDQTTQEVGLAQGNLADEEIAVELIRQFLEALIEKDYAKAGKLFGGVPAERIEKTYGSIRFIRIISIGRPVPCSEAGDSDDHYCFGLHVACAVEIEENGIIKRWEPKYVGVRQVHGQPERWEIIGGFRGI